MAMRTINPNERYDRQRFVDAMEDLEKLVYLSDNLKKPEGNWNPNLRKGLANLLKDENADEIDPDVEINFAGLTPDHVIERAQQEKRDYSDRMDKYAARNWEAFLDKVERVRPEELVDLIESLPLAETSNEELDKIVKAVNEKNLINIFKEKGGQREYVNLKMQGASESRKKAYAYSSGDPNYIAAIFGAYERAADFYFQKAIRDENGNIVPSKLVNLIRENYNRLDADSDKAKIYRLAIVKVAHKVERE